MAFNWYRRLKLGFDLSSRHCISKITPHKPPVFNNIRLISTLNNKQPVKVTKVSSLLSSLPFRYSGYRCYHADRVSTRKRIRNIFLNIYKLLGFQILLVIFTGYVDTVPYTKRIQFLIMHSSLKRAGVSRFRQIKAEYKGKILPSMHPESVRVRKILKDVVEAMQTGLKKQKGLKLPGLYEVVDSINEGLEWECQVLVVKNDDVAYACCFPGGNFVVFTGLLDRFSTDEEIATIIGHEVAHVMAKHVGEKFTNNYFWHYVVWPLMIFVPSFDSVLDLPFSPRMEIEADAIGLLFMASAGYDPRVAPKVLEKLDQACGLSGLRDYFSIHPLGKARRESTSEASVMQDAISIYEEAS